MKNAQKGDTVKVHFTGKLDDGTEIASSQNGIPLEFTIGEGKLIPGFEEGAIGMSEGDHKTVHLEPSQAFGERRAELISKVPRDEIPDHIDLKVGLPLEVSSSSGNALRVLVTEISDDEVTLDANHELAGHSVTFDIELVELVL